MGSRRHLRSLPFWRQEPFGTFRKLSPSISTSKAEDLQNVMPEPFGLLPHEDGKATADAFSHTLCRALQRAKVYGTFRP